MMTFLRISWRNVLRNPRRSMVIVMIIAVGLLGMVFSWAFSEGFLVQMVDTLINSHISHIQIHEKGFNNNPVIRTNIKDHEKIYSLIKNNNNIKYITERIKSQGIINSTEASTGILIIGIDPETEKNVSNIRSFLVEGKFVENDGKKNVFIGKKLAEKLKVGLGDKIVLMGQTVNNEVGGAAYRITGLFRTNSPEFDKSMVFISLKSAENLFEIGENISEFAIIVKEPQLLEKTKKELSDLINTENKYEVLTWKDIMPGMAWSIEISNNYMYVFFIIVLIAISFSIINTLFVVIFERFKELGIMKAIGVKPLHIFFMVLLESLWMALLGIITGTVFSVITLHFSSTVGINLGSFSKGMSMVGLGNILYPTLSELKILECIIWTFVIVTIASLYPAIVASKVKIVEALKFN